VEEGKFITKVSLICSSLSFVCFRSMSGTRSAGKAQRRLWTLWCKQTTSTASVYVCGKENAKTRGRVWYPTIWSNFASAQSLSCLTV